MTHEEALSKLELEEGATSSEINTQYQEFYNEFQMRITNAPTEHQRKLYQKKLEELAAAFEVLGGENPESNTQELPGISVTEVVETEKSAKSSVSNQAEMSKEKALQILGLGEKFTSKELENAFRSKVSSCEKGRDKAISESIRTGYEAALIDLYNARQLLMEFIRDLDEKNNITSSQDRLQGEENSEKSKRKRMKKVMLLLSIFLLAFLLLFRMRIIHYLYTAEDIHGEYTAKQIHRYYPASELHGHYKASEIQGVYSAEEIYGIYTAADIHGVYSAEEIHGIYTAADIYGVYSAEDIYGVYTAAEIHGVYSAEEIYGIYTAADIHGVYSAEEIHGIYTADEIEGVYTLDEINGIYLDVKTKSEPEKINTKKAPTERWKSKYDWVSEFRDGIYWVERNNKHGFTDENGNIVIPLIYDAVDWFQNTLRVRSKSEWFYIDTKGNRLDDFNHSY